FGVALSAPPSPTRPSSDLYGVSYGTKLAVAYALAHPANVERVILDSVVVPTYPDPFDRNVLTQMPATLRRFCSGGTTTESRMTRSGEHPAELQSRSDIVCR